MTATKIDPRDPEDLYCYYCDKQYRRLGNFKRHVIDKHGVGLAKSIGLLPQDEEES